MGRPLNKRLFGAGDGIKNKIRVTFRDDGVSNPGWIVSQRASKRFLCTNGVLSRICSLADKAAADLLDGEMSISGRLDNQDIRRFVKLTARRGTLNSGESIAWNFSSSTTNSKIEMDRSGEDDFSESGAAPAAFTVGQWSVADVAGASGSVTVTITALPVTDSLITSISYRVDNGPVVDAALTGIGNFMITGLTNGTEFDIEIRAGNGTGEGEWSDVKSVTPLET